jgi:hypothetical protein
LETVARSMQDRMVGYYNEYCRHAMLCQSHA